MTALGGDTDRDPATRAGAAPSAPLTAVLELLAGESAAARAFRSGIVLGALVGAAVAGASLVRHRAATEASRRARR